MVLSAKSIVTCFTKLQFDVVLPKLSTYGKLALSVTHISDVAFALLCACYWAVTEFTDSGLSPFTWYEYRVSSDNGFGTALSPAVVYRSSADVPSGNFSAIVERADATSVSLMWTQPSSPNGVIQRYVVSSLDQSSGAVITHYDGLSLGTSVSGLTPYSLHVFIVAACTSVGCLNTSAEAITLQAPPQAQLPPVVVADGPTALNVSWQPPTSPNGQLLSSFCMHCIRSKVALVIIKNMMMMMIIVIIRPDCGGVPQPNQRGCSSVLERVGQAIGGDDRGCSSIFVFIPTDFRCGATFQFGFAA